MGRIDMSNLRDATESSSDRCILVPNDSLIIPSLETYACHRLREGIFRQFDFFQLSHLFPIHAFSLSHQSFHRVDLRQLFSPNIWVVFRRLTVMRFAR